MREVGNPYPMFLDLSGRPLEEGYIYFGETDEDPETAPIDIFFDEEGSIPAEQPLRTISGYISRDGSPARIYTETSEPSIRVRTKAGAQVFYNPRYAGIATDQIGTYAEAQALDISPNITRIQISDRGGPAFVRVDEEPDHPGKLQTLDGWWELDRGDWIKPTYLDDPPEGVESLRWTPPVGVGAAGFNLGDRRNQVTLGCPDATLALQRMKLMQEAGYRWLDYDGHWGVTEGIQIGNDVAPAISSQGITYSGVCVILALNAIAGPLVNMHNVGFCNWAGGELLAGGLGNSWEQREAEPCEYGIVYTGWNSHFVIGQQFAAGFLYDGILNNGSAGNSAHYMIFGPSHITRCGSGLIDDDPGEPYYLEADWSAVDNVTGLATNSTNQFTRLTVSEDIPLGAMTYQESGHYQLWFQADGRCYRIKALNRTTHTIDIYPAVPDHDFPATGTGQYIIPGGFREIGGDAGNNEYGIITASLVSNAYTCGSQYPSQVPTVVGQSCFTPYMSRAEGHAQSGGWVETVYCENNTWNLIVFNGESNQCGIGNLAPATGLSKIVCPARHVQPTTTDWDMDSTSAGLGLFDLQKINGVQIRNQRLANSDPIINMDASGEDVYRYNYNTQTVKVRCDLNLLRIAGGRRKLVIVHGTGTRREPTGTITFDMEDAAQTIQLEGGAPSAGGGTLAFASNKRPLVLMFEADYATGNVTVSQLDRPAITGWGAATGTATRTTFDTATVTLPQLAERFKALTDDLLTVGRIAP